MPRSFRLHIRRTGFTLAAGVGACAIVGQAANLSLAAGSVTLTAARGSLPITGQSASLTVTTPGTPENWATRSGHAEVTYKQNFATPSAVTPYFFDNGAGEVAAGYITVDTTDGTETANCLKIRTPASPYSGTASMAFRHPLSSAWTLNSQSFGTTPFWFSWRMKINAGRLIPSTPGLGWKFFNLAQFSISDGGASGQSNTTAEIVGQDTLARGFPQAYHQDGASFPPFETTAVQGPGSDINFENAYDVGSGTPNQRYCLYGASGVDYPGCWHWPVDQWFAMKVRVKFGTYGGSTNNQFDMWTAREGETSWTHLHAWGDNVSLPFTLGVPQSGYSGSNGIHWHIYETGRTGSSADAIVKYDEIIVSTADIAVPASTALGTLAAGMAAGTWAALTVSNQNSALADTGSSGSPIHYTNSMPWNPVSKVIEIVASDHHGATPSMRHIRYVASSNSFVEAQTQPVVSGIGHGYDHSSVNPYTGDLYHRIYGSVTTGLKTYGASTFNESAIATWDNLGYSQVAIGSCWWSGSFTGGSGGGTQGIWLIFNSAYSGTTPHATDGQIVGYNPVAASWTFNATSMAPNSINGGSSYHSVMEYSTVRNVAVFGGGNDSPNKIFRLNSNGTSTALTNVPTAAGMGVQRGIICEDPVSGNFLLLGNGQLWELNPTGSGTWTQQTGSRAPPAGVGNPSAPDGVICCPIAEYGVVAYITQTSTTGGTFYLYKHA